MTIDATLDRFFRDRRVAVLAIPRDAGRPPLTTPIWYDWDGASSASRSTTRAPRRSGSRSSAARPCRSTIQSEVPPYRYAVVYGTATLGPSTDPALRTRVARRYFGRIAGDQYVAAGDRRRPRRGVTPRDHDHARALVSHDFGPEAGWFGRAVLPALAGREPGPGLAPTACRTGCRRDHDPEAAIALRERAPERPTTTPGHPHIFCSNPTARAWYNQSAWPATATSGSPSRTARSSPSRIRTRT